MTQYSNVCRNIIEHYHNLLSEQEINTLKKIIKIDNYDNSDIIIFINKLIDRIWNMTLTKPQYYKEGESFTFLTAKDLIPSIYNTDFVPKTSKNTNHFLELVTEKSILNNSIGINGFIVEIDYLNDFSEPLLPIDFENKKRILLKTKLNIQGVYNITLNLKDIEAEEKITNDFSETTQLKKISINKPIYNASLINTPLSEKDIDDLVDAMLVYYLSEHKFKDIINLRDTLKNTYKNIIINKYLEFFYNQITLDEFINYIFNTLDKNDLLTQVDKQL